MIQQTASSRENLPQLNNSLNSQPNRRFFITDGGLETVLVFHEGIQLPYFAAFVLLKDAIGRETLHRYYEKYVAIAHKNNVGLILESPTWRASADWGQQLSYSASDLDEINREAIALLQAIRTEHETYHSPMVVSGCVGPQGDGYSPDSHLSADEAAHYHSPQISSFAAAGADMVCAITMTYSEEAIGISRAAQAANIPVAISFTVETDGHLPSGQSLPDAIQQVDTATGNAPAYYMINCAHPTHFYSTLATGEPWTDRIFGIRANASRKSHAELDESDSLDDGNPAELGAQYVQLRNALRHLSVVGGCCGTDHRHIEAICQAYKLQTNR
ncbi:MAG: homocysteine S-methyltransferase family protein [Phormidesmis sp.]